MESFQDLEKMTKAAQYKWTEFLLKDQHHTRLSEKAPAQKTTDHPDAALRGAHCMRHACILHTTVCRDLAFTGHLLAGEGKRGGGGVVLIESSKLSRAYWLWTKAPLGSIRRDSRRQSTPGCRLALSHASHIKKI